MSESSIPIVCALSPNEFAGRLEGFRQLFAAHLGGIERPTPTRLRLVLSAAAGLDRVRDLMAREQQCCAFLTFTVTPTDGQLVVDADVPAEAAPTLDGMASVARLSAPGVGRDQVGARVSG